MLLWQCLCQAHYPSSLAYTVFNMTVSMLLTTTNAVSGKLAITLAESGNIVRLPMLVLNTVMLVTSQAQLHLQAWVMS